MKELVGADDLAVILQYYNLNYNYNLKLLMCIYFLSAGILLSLKTVGLFKKSTIQFVHLSDLNMNSNKVNFNWCVFLTMQMF